MFNLFKKKDDMNSFKLDEETLPSMSESPGPGMPSNNSPPADLGMPNFENVKTEQDFSNPVGTNPSSAAPSNPFAQQSSNPFAQGIGQSQPAQQDNSSLHNDLTKAKLEMIESKIALIDSKIANMDNKIDMIYQLIVSEVSQETKAKMNINNAMDRLRKSQ